MSKSQKYNERQCKNINIHSKSQQPEYSYNQN